MRDMYEDMKRALAIQTEALAAQVAALQSFRQQIAEAQDRWNMAMDMQSANELMAGFSQPDALGEVLKRDAIDATISRLNEGFAALETSMKVDYRTLPPSVSAEKAQPLEVITRRLESLEF
jgi:seryl-tRNA(Sec) selenium transferase